MSKRDTQVLIEVRDELREIKHTLNDLKDDLRTDRKMVWKVLLLTIAGAFALIGIKIVFP